MRVQLAVSTPGRICLFGEHQDYLGLPVIPAAISRRITIQGVTRNDPQVNLDLPDIHSRETFSLDAQLEYTRPHDYLRSAVNVLRRHGFHFHNGFEGSVRSTIPIQAGTSSSSALLVSWVHLLASLCGNDATLSSEQIARLAHEAEVLEFDGAGGMMDQYSTAIGGVIAIDFLPTVKVERIDCHFGTFVLGDSAEPKDTQGILTRVKDGVLAILNRLSQASGEFSLLAMSEDRLDPFTPFFSSEEFALLRGTVRNHAITMEARQLLKNRPLDESRFGNLLLEHQHILREVLRISTPKIDRMLDAAMNAGALGGKINGSGGGGCMFAYAPENPKCVAEAIERAGGKAYIISVDEGTRKEPRTHDAE